MKHLLLSHRDTEAVVDAVIEGAPLTGGNGLDEVEAFLSDMRTEFAATPAPAPRPTLASTLDGRRPLRPASGPVPKPTFPERRPRSRFGVARPAAVVFATSAVLFSGLAGAGALPGPLQRSTADLGSHVGLHLPGATTVATSPGTTSEVTTPTSGSRGTSGGSGSSSANGSGSGSATTSPTNATTGSDGGTLTSPTTVATPTPTLPTSPTVPLPVPLPNLGSGTTTLTLPSVPQVLAPVTHSHLLPKKLRP